MKKRYILWPVFFLIVYGGFKLFNWSIDDSFKSIKNGDVKEMETSSSVEPTLYKNGVQSASEFVKGQAIEGGIDYLVDKYCEDKFEKESYESLVNYLKTKTTIRSSSNDFENYEIILPSKEHRRLQIAQEESEDGAVTKNIYVYRVDADGLPEKMEFDFNGITNLEEKLAYFLKEGELLWKKVVGNLILSNNQTVFYELENGLITKLETLTASGISIGCLQEEEAFVCNCE